MEVPAEQEGRVVDVAVGVGDRVASGAVIVTVEVSSAIAEPPQPEVVAATPVAAEPALTPLPSLSLKLRLAPRSTHSTIYAGPACGVWRELGVSLEQVKGSGQRGRITKDDLKNHVKQQISHPNTGFGIPEVPAVDFSRFGPVHEDAMTRMQQQVAVNMQRSWLNVPHVTQHDSADISDLEEFRQSPRPKPANAVSSHTFGLYYSCGLPCISADAKVQQLVASRQAAFDR